MDVPMDYQEQIDRMTAKKTGYLVNRHRIVVEGLCPDCQKESQACATASDAPTDDRNE